MPVCVCVCVCVRDSLIISCHVAISNLWPITHGSAESNCEDQSQKKEDDVVASKECVKRVAAAHTHTQTNKEQRTDTHTHARTKTHSLTKCCLCLSVVCLQSVSRRSPRCLLVVVVFLSLSCTRALFYLPLLCLRACVCVCVGLVLLTFRNF